MTNAPGTGSVRAQETRKYYLLTTLESAISGVNHITTGGGYTSPNEITFYHELVPYKNHYNDILEKYVDIESEGQTVNVTLTSRLKVSHALLAGIKKAGRSRRHLRME